jgi:hypothetical protein
MSRSCILVAAMFVALALSSSSCAGAKMTSAEAKVYLLKACGGGGWNNEYYKRKEAASVLDLGDIVALLEEIKVAYGDQSDLGPFAPNRFAGDILLLLYSDLIERHWDQVAYRYLTIVPPSFVASYGDSLEGYMAKGGFGGLGNLFTLYYHAETPYAKAQLFQCIQNTFQNIRIPETEPDKYVEYVEGLYWKNLKWIRINDQYPRNHGLVPPVSIPRGLVNIGLFFVPERLIEKTESGYKPIDKRRP